jgi:dipeptidyl aminopeptidase/acylaminoacyl peptidase
VAILQSYCPLRQASADFPPVLFLHGDQDTDVPYQQSVEMAERLKALGVEHRLMLLPGRGHVFDTTGKRLEDPAILEVFDSVLEFLAERLRK